MLLAPHLVDWLDSVKLFDTSLAHKHQGMTHQVKVKTPLVHSNGNSDLPNLPSPIDL